MFSSKPSVSQGFTMVWINRFPDLNLATLHMAQNRTSVIWNLNGPGSLVILGVYIYVHGYIHTYYHRIHVCYIVTNMYHSVP